MNIFAKPSAVSTTSRAVDFSLHLIAGLHVIMAAILLFTLLILTPAVANAEENESCEGTNLLSELKNSAPERFAEISSAAAQVANGSGLLWKIVPPNGAQPSYLFGTMHVTDPRVLDLASETRAAIAAANTVVIETTDILDPAKAQAAILARPDLTMFTDGTNIASYLSEEELQLVESKLKERGIPLPLVSNMKPWMIASFVALPACEMARKNSGQKFLDHKIAADATAAGKTLKGLETLEEQLSAMASLPVEFHVRGLVETLALGTMMADVMTTMTELYVSGETGMILPMIRAVSESTGGTDDEAGYAEFEQKIVEARNAIMAERAAPIIDQGAAFVAVGALHLPGQDGVVERLRNAGYTVTRVKRTKS